MRRRLRVLLVLATCLTLQACSGTWQPPITRSAPDVDDLRITETTTPAVEGQSQLSPDGTRIISARGEPCVHILDTDEKRCIPENTLHADLQRAQWSPDGATLTVTDDFWRAFREPDVWTFDTAGGGVRNLTDDGVDKIDLSDPDPDTVLDILPSWTPDGEAIRFARGRRDDERAQLVQVDADGGDVEVVREIDCPVIRLFALTWSRDKVAWTCDRGEVWLGDLDDGAERVFTGKEEDRMALSFSPDGRWLLVDSLEPYARLALRPGGYARAVPVDGGDPVRVTKNDDEAVAFPTWSPTGHAIAYVDHPGVLKVVAEPGGEPRELRKAEMMTASDGVRLNWAPGRMFVVLDGEPTLLTLTG